MNVQSHLIAHYVRQLREEATQRLTLERAEELVADIEADLNERIKPEASEAEVRTALERLGSPSELVDAAGGMDLSATPTQQGIRGEVIALACLLSSATLLLFIPPLAAIALLVGLILLLRSAVWNTLDKVLACIAYLVAGAPGIMLAGLASFRSSTGSCESPPSSGSSDLGPLTCGQPSNSWLPWLLLSAVVALHLLTLIRLIRRLRTAH